MKKCANRHTRKVRKKIKLNYKPDRRGQKQMWPVENNSKLINLKLNYIINYIRYN